MCAGLNGQCAIRPHHRATNFYKAKGSHSGGGLFAFQGATMTAETREALEAALTAHFASEFEGAYLTEWFCIGFGVNLETDEDCYLRMMPKAQPQHRTGGLIDFAATRHHARLNASFDK